MKSDPTEISMETVAQYFIRVPGSKEIRLTKAGKERFRTDFARVGYRVEEIRTISQFFKAHNSYLNNYFESVAANSSTEPAIKQLLTQ